MSDVLETKYKTEAAKRWGNTEAYKEFSVKNASTSREEFGEIIEGLENIFSEFAACMQNKNAPDSAGAQALVSELQEYISANFYNCTDEILAGLGQMYSADARFRNSIDKHGEGTAEYVSKAIQSKLRV